MGVNLFIDAPGWDAFANGGMKTIFQDHARFPKVWRRQDADDVAFRPADFAAWRTELYALNCNVDMWLAGMRELEHNSAKWIDASY